MRMGGVVVEPEVDLVTPDAEKRRVIRELLAIHDLALALDRRQGEIRLDARLGRALVARVDDLIDAAGLEIAVVGLDNHVSAVGQSFILGLRLAHDESAVDEVLEAGDAALQARLVVMGESAVDPDATAVYL